MNWSVLPHPGGSLEPPDLWTAWNVDPWVLIPMALAPLIYVWGGAGNMGTVQCYNEKSKVYTRRW